MYTARVSVGPRPGERIGKEPAESRGYLCSSLHLSEVSQVQYLSHHGTLPGSVLEAFPRADTVAKRGVLSKSLGRCKDPAAEAVAAGRGMHGRLLRTRDAQDVRSSIVTHGPSFSPAPLALSLVLMGASRALLGKLSLGKVRQYGSGRH